jgi:hypothetical protein
MHVIFLKACNQLKHNIQLFSMFVIHIYMLLVIYSCYYIQDMISNQQLHSLFFLKSSLNSFPYSEFTIIKGKIILNIKLFKNNYYSELCNIGIMKNKFVNYIKRKQRK